MIRSILAATLALGFAGTAAASTSFTVTLEAPMEKSEKVAAAKALWSCVGDTCTAKLNRKTVRVSTCKKVAKKVGKVAVFTNGDESLSEEDLAKCNASAK